MHRGNRKNKRRVKAKWPYKTQNPRRCLAPCDCFYCAGDKEQYYKQKKLGKPKFARKRNKKDDE